jgi:hypothetical protein
MTDCLQACEYILGEWWRHHAHNPTFAARLLPGCHSPYELCASCRAKLVAMDSRMELHLYNPWWFLRTPAHKTPIYRAPLYLYSYFTTRNCYGYEIKMQRQGWHAHEHELVKCIWAFKWGHGPAVCQGSSNG